MPGLRPPCRPRFSNPVSGGQCHLIHIHILRRFSWPSLKVNVKVHVNSLISSRKTYHPTLYLTPWPLDLFIRVPFQIHREHTVLQTFRRIQHNAHCHICPTKCSFSPESSEAFEGEVPCPRTQHRNNVLRLREEKHNIYLKTLHQAGFETARQAATLAKRHALTIASRPSIHPHAAPAVDSRAEKVTVVGK